MNYYQYRPAQPLAAFVKQFWLYEGFDQNHLKERVLPTGTAQLVFNLQSDRFQIYDPHNPAILRSYRGSLAVGPHSEYFVIDTASQAAVMGVAFKPGGAFPFFKIPAYELRDRHIALEDLWGGAAQEVRESLMAAPTPAAKFAVFERMLLRQLVRPLELRPAVNYALGEFKNSPAFATVAGMAGQTGYSTRRFMQLFNEEVGLTPKLYWRVQRFQATLRRLHRGQVVNWSDLSLRLGYFDQAHFNHDFLAFSGLNPATYLSRRGPHQNHVPLP
jgi:AraC-like DNA-binding protein